ncbi:cytochrome D1 domain-containing protein, partial [Stutzerimonas frequens]|uniref:cytochrome D1 domain-containing protein n=1 Tax=Stutzerimonas frequens TaxID=2968969 RepID=UPI0040383D63
MSKRRTCGVIRSLQLAVAWLLACALVASAQAEALWTPEDIALSRHVPREAEATDSPAYEADPLGLILVVEAGGSHVTILDGEKLEPIHHFVTRGVHGSPCFTRDGRFVF